MPSTWEPANGRNVSTVISLYAQAFHPSSVVHSSQNTKLSPARPAGFRSCCVADERGGRLFYRPSSLPSSFLCFPLPPTRSLPLCLPRTALSSHPIRHPSLLPLFSVLSPHLRVSHITPGIDRAEISGARSFFVLHSAGVRIHLACSRATIQGTRLFPFSYLKLRMNVISTKYDWKSTVSLFLFIS